METRYPANVSKKISSEKKSYETQTHKTGDATDGKTVFGLCASPFTRFAGQGKRQNCE